jgi:hypothetical protein
LRSATAIRGSAVPLSFPRLWRLRGQLACRYAQPHTRLPTIKELNSGPLECALDLLKITRLRHSEAHLIIRDQRRREDRDCCELGL